MSLDPLPAEKAPRVFISYSHDSPAHSLKVLALADALRDHGVDAWLDQYEPSPEKGWIRWMQAQVAQADFVLLVCTATYCRRFDGEDEPNGAGLGVGFEGAVIGATMYRQRMRQQKFLPILLAPEDADHVPLMVDSSRFVVEDPADFAQLEPLLRLLTAQPATPAQPLGRLPSLPQKPRLSIFSKVAPAGESTAIAAYRAWALERYSRLDLVGLGAKDFGIAFDDIYVPLRTEQRFEPRFQERLGGAVFEAGELPRARGFETLEIDRIFLEITERHALLLGEPGSGKTTALKKLHRLLLQHDPQMLGLPPGTLPVFLRLRRLGSEFYKGPLVAFLARELDDLSSGRLPGALAEELWQRPLLLLFDGLDEIGDIQRRADVCRYLTGCLEESGACRARALFSCRRSGWQINLPLGLETAHLEVRPLQPPQIALLVRAFFREAGRLLGTHDPVEAAKDAERLILAIEREENASAHVRVMVSTPLLLTLLCVLVFRGNEIPRHRVAFYEQCLRILLGSWRRQAEGKPPVDVELGLVLLEDLASELHRAGRREGLTELRAAVLWKGRLPRQQAFEVFGWLYHDAGVLALYEERSFGFMHLGLQEYLMARWLAKREGEIPQACCKLAESWWQEVLLQLSAIDRRSFAAVVKGFISAGALLTEAYLFRTCLEETSDPDYAPFLEALRERGPEEQAVVLRLLRGRFSPELIAEAERLEQEGGSNNVRLLARDLRLAAQEGAESRGYDVALLAEEADAAAATRIGTWLSRKGMSIYAPPKGKSWRDHGEEILDRCRALVLVLGPEAPSPNFRRDATSLFELADEGVLRLLVSLPEVPMPIDLLPAELEVEPVALSHLDDASPVFRALERGQRVPALVVAEPRSRLLIAGKGVSCFEGEPFLEPLTGENFLWVPGGGFQMGSERWYFSQPPHRVRLDPFWLARTPVTNSQYRCFLEANPDTAEPHYWREARFSAPEQPVVAVSWEDAVKYCQWLAAASGLPMSLPTEAQWEFAARGGAEQREYPWGNDEPHPSHARYRLRSQDSPAVVGSHPAGAGLFGHLDLAGNVWEWCRDAWSPNYKGCRSLEQNPCQEQGGKTARILRGGGFWGGEESLRSAIRDRDGPGHRSSGVGFRLAVSPANLVLRSLFRSYSLGSRSRRKVKGTKSPTSPPPAAH